MAMAKQQTEAVPASANERLQKCAARAREADRLANEAHAKASRLRKEMKRARKAYKAAKQIAKAADKKSKRAQAELSERLNQAFRDLAVALQKEESAPPKTPACEASAITHLQAPRDGNSPSQQATAAA